VPFDVPAGASESIEWTVGVVSPGPFKAQLHVYLDDHGLRELTLVVRGTVVPSGQEGPQKPESALEGSLPAERVP
jgi:hypothetical protein